MLTQKPTNRSLNKVRLGRPIKLNEAQLVELSKVTEFDIAYTAEQWRLLVPAKFALLLNAIGILKGGSGVIR